MKLTITTFTDPMMGLSYESEPLFRKLETHYDGSISFKNIMSGLVCNVYLFVDRNASPFIREEAIKRYNKKLAKIYEDEEKISGMPINMKDFRLFDTNHISSLPLNLAYKAAQIASPDKAELFLYNLRYATIVECRPTTYEEEIIEVARKTGIDSEQFRSIYHSEEAQNELDKDLDFMRKLNVYSLPTYLLEYGGESVILQSFRYRDFVSAISEISDGKLLPEAPVASTDNIKRLIDKHPLISPIEIREAFDFGSTDEVKERIRPLIEKGYIELFDVYHGEFIKKKGYYE